MIEPILTIVVPCFNEEEVFPDTVAELTNLITDMVNDKQISHRSRLLSSMMEAGTEHGSLFIKKV